MSKRGRQESNQHTRDELKVSGVVTPLREIAKHPRQNGENQQDDGIEDLGVRFKD